MIRSSFFVLQNPLIISIVLSSVATGLLFVGAMFAYRNFRISGRERAWAYIALGLSIASFATGLHAIHVGQHEAIHPENMAFELVMVAVGALIILGLMGLRGSVRQAGQVAQDLRANEAILRAVLDNAPIGIVIRDLDHRFRLANKVYRETFSITEEVPGKSSFDLLPKEIAEEVYQQDQEVIASGEPVIAEIDDITPSGPGRLLLARFPVRDDTGAISGVGRIGIDVTDAYKTRQKLAEQQKLFELALSRGNIGIWRFEIATGNLFLSRNWELLAGCGPNEYVTTMDAWVARLDASMRAASRARIAQFSKADDEQIFEYVVKFLNGSTYWLESRVTPVLNDAGFVEAVIGVDADITDRKSAELALQEREALLSSIFDNLPVSLLIKDNERRFETQNQAYTDWYGKSPDELVGRRYEELSDFQQKEEGDAAREQEETVVQTGDIVNRELRRTFADGSVHQVRITKFPIRDQSGEIVKIGSVGVDLTELYQTQAALLEANVRLEKANRAKSEFLAHMSHELRTPLNSVIGFAQMISEQQVGELKNAAYLEYAGLINTSAQHLLNVINDILDISKVEAGEMRLDEKAVDVADAVEQSFKIISPRSNAKGHRLLNSIATGLPAITADPRLLQQILLNLLANAVKFTPSGGEISVSASLIDAGALEIIVDDNGIGIARKDIPRVLEPFGQVRSSATVSHDGKGLGLSLSRKLMNLHDGTLEIDGEREVGTRVRLIFPPHRVVEATTEEASDADS